MYSSSRRLRYKAKPPATIEPLDRRFDMSHCVSSGEERLHPGASNTLHIEAGSWPQPPTEHPADTQDKFKGLPGLFARESRTDPVLFALGRFAMQSPDGRKKDVEGTPWESQVPSRQYAPLTIAADDASSMPS